MGRLQFCDYHNMVAILEKGEFNSDFHPMVDFIAASPLRYALTVKPTIFVSHIRQFWSTSRIETTDEGTHILAIVDGIQRTVSESSLRRNLKLRDEDGIVSISDTELFKNLTLMGIVPLFDTMLVHQGEGSGIPTEPHHTPSPKADTSHPTTSSIPLPSIPTAPIPLITQPDTTPIRQYSRRARIALSSALPTVADEPASPVRDVSEGEACPTDSGFIADQDRATIAKVKVLEDKEDVVVPQSGDDAPIKGRSINEGEVAAERISNDSEEISRVLTSMDAATVLAGGIDVPTGSGFIPTAGPPATVISIGSEKKLQEQIDAQVARELEEQQEKENIRMNEQIARDAEVARIHAEEELQGMIDSLDKSNETIAKYLQEYHDFASELHLEKRIELISDLVKYQDNYSKANDQEAEREYYMAMIRSNLGWRVKDFKGMSFEEIEAKFAEVWKQVEDFIPMGSKEETERLKRKGLNLEQEQVKKKKSSEEAPEIKTSTKDVTKEKIKEMMQEDLNQLLALVKEYLSIRPATSEKEMELWVEIKRMYEPDPKDQLWTLTQNFMHAQVEWKLYDLSGVHHLTAKDREIFMLVEKNYPLRKGLALVMISYKLQVENYSQMAKDLIRKIYNIANTLRRSIKFRGGLLGIKCTRHSYCQVKSSHWQYKFPLPVKVVATARRLEMPLPKVCTAIEEKKKKLPVKDRWQLH
nr:hypothetical protein [Tanacetum cinerariifolium]